MEPFFIRCYLLFFLCKIGGVKEITFFLISFGLLLLMFRKK